MNLTEIYYLHEIGGKKNQEDYIWPVPGTAAPDDKIFIVCDGVGGSENGEIASKIVAQSVGTALLKAADREISTPFINQLLHDARQKLIDYARLHQLSTNMATTFSLLIFIGERAFISWCGDSRVYHLRGGEILFKTEDHSLVSSLVKSGEITEEEAHSHPQKNLLLKAVNANEADPEAEGHWTEEILDGDYFMLCTDGLLENIGDRDIKFLLAQNDKGSIDLLPSIQKFCYNKTRDNYSMYLVRVKTAEKEQDPPKKKVYRWLALPLVLAAAAGGFAVRENFFARKKVIDVVKPVNLDKDSLEKADSIARETAADPAPGPVTPTDSLHTAEAAARTKDSLVKTSALAGKKDSFAKTNALTGKKDSLIKINPTLVKQKDSANKTNVLAPGAKDSLAKIRQSQHKAKPDAAAVKTDINKDSSSNPAQKLN